MSRRGASVLAWSLWGLFVAMLVSAIGLGAVNGEPIVLANITNSLAFLALATVGAVVASRSPSNPLGWIYCAAAILTTMQEGLTQYSRYVSYTKPGVLPGGVLAMWAANWVWVPGFSLVLVFSFLLFPDGRLPTPRWRPAAWCAAAIVAFLTVTSALYTADYTDSIGRPVPNPFAIPALSGFFDAALGVAQILFVLPVMLALASLVVRFRRSRGEEREQIKWLLWAAALIAIFMALPLHQGESDVTNAISGLLITLIPISAGIAILKYHLYDIDVVINKTVVYGALAAFITVVYVAIVVGLGRVIDSSSDLALSIAATAVVAIAFQPVRERVQRYVNRLIYGKRATPYEVMAGFAHRVSGSLSVEQILPEMAEVAARGVAARAVRVSVTLPHGGRRAETWPSGEEGPFDRSLDVAYKGEVIGMIEVAWPADRSVRPGEERLLTDLAAHSGLALHNVRLTEELVSRARELAVQSEGLRVSRERLVTARDAQRRGLERDIREGPQRQLQEIRRELEAVEASDAAEVEERLDALTARANDTLDGLRDLARGIFPPLLADKGIVPALEAHIRKVGAHATVDATPGFELLRFDDDTEACVYFCCLQAIQNITRHAARALGTIHLDHGPNGLAVTVSDDGPGFDPAAATRGMGLEIMQDRVDALDGDLVLASTPGGGTTVRIELPARALDRVTA